MQIFDYSFISNYPLSILKENGVFQLNRISHKILKKSDEMLCEMHRECARDHYQVDKARAIRDEDRMTGRLNFSRVCEKCGLSTLQRKVALAAFVAVSYVLTCYLLYRTFLCERCQ